MQLGIVSNCTNLMSCLQESLTKLGVGCKDEVENWFTGEKLGLSGYDRPSAMFE